MRAALWLALGCAACSDPLISLGAGRGSEEAGLSDASTTDAASTDAGRPEAGAPEGGAFSEPSPVANISTDGGRDDDPSLSADLTLLFFNSRREGGKGREDIWFATRASAADPWEAPRALEALNTDERETGIALSADGLRLWFSSDRDGGQGGLDVYLSTRGARSEDWSAPERVVELCSNQDDLISAVTEDGRTAYLARREGEDDDYDLYVAMRESSAAAFTAPVPLTELNSEKEESDAFPFAEGLRLVLTRDEDLWQAERSQRPGPFSLSGALDELNSDADDRDAWLSQDGRYVVFSSDRDGNYALFEARR
ncbi:MAG TPA: hypothetical protein VFZ61_14050 [Polyangiales bacterium]